MEDKINEMHKRNLYRLGELDDYQVDENDPDVRGWEAVDRDNKQIGKISELIVNPDELKVRYLDILTTPYLSPHGKDRHLLIPIGTAVVDEKEDRVRINDLDIDTLKEFPEYQGEIVTSDYEQDLVDRIRRSRNNGDAITNDEIYNDPMLNDEGFYRPRGRSIITSGRMRDAYHSIRKKGK